MYRQIKECSGLHISGAEDEESEDNSLYCAQIKSNDGVTDLPVTQVIFGSVVHVAARVVFLPEMAAVSLSVIHIHVQRV